MRWKKVNLFHKNNTSFSYYDDDNLVFTLISIFVDMIDIELWSFTFEFVSEWLLFNANSAILQLYHDENKLIFNEMMMKSTLY